MLNYAKLFLKSGKPSKSALELYEYIKEELQTKRGAVRLHLKTYSRGDARVNRGEHTCAFYILDESGIEFDEGNDDYNHGEIGDYFELERSEARKFLRMIEKAAA